MTQISMDSWYCELFAAEPDGEPSLDVDDHQEGTYE